MIIPAFQNVKWKKYNSGIKGAECDVPIAVRLTILIIQYADTRNNKIG